jgi:ankyrin repeat protein
MVSLRPHFCVAFIQLIWHSLLIGDLDLVRWLIGQGADPNVVLPSGNTPLSHAVSRSSLDVIKLLGSHYIDFGVGDLIYCATDRQDLDVLRFLIDAGVPVDEILWDRYPAYETKSPFTRGTALHRACELRSIEMVDILIKAGASPNKKQSKFHEPQGETPYELARREGYVDIVAVLQRAMFDS